ncbi:pilin [Marinicella litoralis]|uniref:Pilin n=1 Tax=Marinicella litoralis TaxID=644220 RepID=A0A4R6XVK3_9GAMM|nr:pilin [Marinicella litoralis]TDR22589.1 pilin [Marinicella litoralis]
MHKTKGMLLVGLFFSVFISGCDNTQINSSDEGIRKVNTSYEVEQHKTAWLRDHLPDETLAYINVPTPWNYLFDAKADALHAVQSLSAHVNQVAAIKQGVKDNYYQYLPAELKGMVALLLDHVATSFEVAVINDSPTAVMPSVAVATKLHDITADELGKQLTAVLQMLDPSIELLRQGQDAQWSFQSNRLPAFVRFEQSTGKLLIFGGMGVNLAKMTDLWEQAKTDQLIAIKQLSQQSDPSGLNLKMWLAPAKMYQLGASFVPPEQHKLVSQLGLDQMDYIWLGAESAEGQSAMALHVLMPEAGWRLMLPRASDWFDVNVAGTPRSVIQMALPTSDQVKQAISHFKLDQMLSEKDRKEMKSLFEFEQTLGFDLYDFFDAYYQQIYMVTDDSGSWWAMKIKDEALHQKLNDSMYAFFDINPEKKSLSGVEIMQAHFSVYAKFMESSVNQSPDMAQVKAFMNMFKDHVYWYIEDGVYYMSTVPQILADKRNTDNPLKLSDWLDNNQGGHWDSAVLAYGKDVTNMPQSLYHFYLLMLQGLGDMAQVKVDLFALPTAKELNLPDRGRINVVLSSDAEKVSFKVGYEYSLLESVLSAEGGMATIAIVGILAAYAIPAYRDYEVRAQVAAQLAMAGQIKATVSEQWFVNQSFAGSQAALGESDLNYSIDETTGVIVIDLADVGSSFEAGDVIYLEPVTDEGYVEWRCSSNIKSAYLPAFCRDE